MAEVIRDARAVRAEARRLRGELAQLEVAVRRSAAHTREQRVTAAEALIRVQARRDTVLPSPWSTLDWSYDPRSLADVLVSIV